MSSSPDTNSSLGSLAIYVGFVIGVLNVIDWLLSEEQKDWIRKRLEDTWIWLAELQLSALLYFVRSRYFQFAVAALSLVWLAVTVAYTVILGSTMPGGMSRTFASPFRVYPFQIWIDLTFFPVAAVLVAYKWYPKVVASLTTVDSTWAYVKRLLAFFGKFMVSTYAFLALIWLLLFLLFGQFPDRYPGQAPEDKELLHRFEAAYGGKAGAVLIPTILSAIASFPVVAMFHAFLVLLLSVLWLLLTAVLISSVQLFMFLLFRVVAYEKGPVLGLSALLIGLGAIIKGFLGKE